MQVTHAQIKNSTFRTNMKCWYALNVYPKRKSFDLFCYTGSRNIYNSIVLYFSPSKYSRVTQILAYNSIVEQNFNNQPQQF